MILIYAALLLQLSFFQFISAQETITVDITTLITITSCNPTVKDCPGSSHLFSSIALAPIPITSISSILFPSLKIGSSSCLTKRCNADNCLRAFERGQGQGFCSTFTQSIVTNISGLPKFATQCAGSTISRVSSACSCLNQGCNTTNSGTTSVSAVETSKNVPATTVQTVPGISQVETSSSAEQTFSEVSSSSALKVTQSPTTQIQSPSPTPINGSSDSQIEFSRPPTSLIPVSTISSTPIQTSEDVSSSNNFGSSTIAAPFSIIQTPTSQEPAFTPPSTAMLPSSSQIPPQSAPQSQQPSIALPSASQSTLPRFTTTITQTNALGSLFTSVFGVAPSGSADISITVVPIESIPSSSLSSLGSQLPSVSVSVAPDSKSIMPPFITTITQTNALGSVFTTIAQVTPSGLTAIPTAPVPSQQLSGSQLAQGPTSPVSTLPESQSAVPPFTTTLTQTNALGSIFTTVVQVTPSGPLAISSAATSIVLSGSQFSNSITSVIFPPTDLSTPGISAESSSQPPVPPFSASVVPPFTTTLTQTNGLGSIFTTVVQITPSGPANVPTAPSPTFVPTGSAAPSATLTGFPLITPPPSPTFTECNMFFTTNVNWPSCLYPPAINMPTSCSPLPDCLFGITGVIPQTVQSELSYVCDTTPILSCLGWTDGSSCTQFPECLSTEIDTGICWGLPFPDCLFTLYVPSITSTITTTPPGFSTIEISRTDWTTNTIYTTQDSSGNQLILPVLTPCPWCPSFIDTIISGIPDILNTDIEIPGLPKLPKFHLPCIFFCKKGKPHHKPKPPVVDQEPPEPSSEEPSTSTSCQASTATDCTIFLTESVSGTLTNTVTTTSCFTLALCSASGTMVTIATTTSAIVTATPYYISARENIDAADFDAFTDILNQQTDPTTLDVFAVPEANLFTGWYQILDQSQVDVFSQNPAVVTIALETLSNENYDLISWQNIGNFHDSTVPQNYTESYIRRQEQEIYVEQQVTTFAEMKVISQPPTIDLDSINTYAYVEENPEIIRARVYVLDSGATPGHVEYQGIGQNSGQQPEWLWPGSAGDGADEFAPYDYVTGVYDDNDAVSYHGTCMLSKIVGNTVGISKDAYVTIVRNAALVPSAAEIAAGSTPVGHRPRVGVLGLQAILSDVIAKKAANQATLATPPVVQTGPTTLFTFVLNLSLSITATAQNTLEYLGGPENPSNWNIYKTLEALINEGVVVVVSSGNNGDPANPDPGLPTKPAGQNPKQFTSLYALLSGSLPITVVGATDVNGLVPAWVQYTAPPTGDFITSGVHLWAPGTAVSCASFAPNGLQVVAGTSPAAATVAGMYTNFLNNMYDRPKIEQLYQNFIPQYTPGQAWSYAIRQYAMDLAYLRSPGGATRVLYNGQIPENSNNQAVCQAIPNRKRQEPGGCEPASEIASASAASVASVASAQSVASVLSVASVASVSSFEAASSAGNSIMGPPFTVGPDSSQLSAFSAASVASVSSFEAGSSAGNSIQGPPFTVGQPPATTAGPTLAPLPTSTPTTTTQALPPPPPPPPPQPTTSIIPHATCAAEVLNLEGDTLVAIWTNYITDGGSALEAAEKLACPGPIKNWNQTSIQVSNTESGVTWESNERWDFIIPGLTHPESVQCVVRGIQNSGGPEPVGNGCEFTALCTDPIECLLGFFPKE